MECQPLVAGAGGPPSEPCYRILQNSLVVVRRKDGTSSETPVINIVPGDMVLCLSRDYRTFVFLICTESEEADPSETARGLTAFRIGRSCDDVLLADGDVVFSSRNPVSSLAWQWKRADAISPGDALLCASHAIRNRLLGGGSVMTRDAVVSGVRIHPVNPHGTSRWMLCVPESRGLIVNGIVVRAGAG